MEEAVGDVDLKLLMMNPLPTCSDAIEAVYLNAADDGYLTFDYDAEDCYRTQQPPLSRSQLRFYRNKTDTVL